MKLAFESAFLKSTPHEAAVITANAIPKAVVATVVVIVMLLGLAVLGLLAYKVLHSEEAVPTAADELSADEKDLSSNADAPENREK